VELIALFYPPAEQCKPPSLSLNLSLHGFPQSAEVQERSKAANLNASAIRLSCSAVRLRLQIHTVVYIQEYTDTQIQL